MSFKRFEHCSNCGELIDWENAPALNAESVEQGHYLDVGKETWLYKCRCGQAMGGYISEVEQVSSFGNRKS